MMISKFRNFGFSVTELIACSMQIIGGGGGGEEEKKLGSLGEKLHAFKFQL